MNLDKLIFVTLTLIFHPDRYLVNGLNPAFKISSELREFYDTSIEDVSDDETEAEELTRNVIVEFTGKTTHVMDRFDLFSVEDKKELHQKYKTTLETITGQSQRGVQEFLNEEEAEFKSFWLTNQVFVKDASLALCESMANFDTVKFIRPEKMYHLHKPLHAGPVIEIDKDATVDAEPQWNVKIIQANKVWSTSTGKGVTVGVIDTGCRATHQDLGKNKFHAFHDAIGKKAEVYDDQGHGTHVHGIIAMVAPGATFYTCKACNKDGGCPENALTECCEWITEKSPNIVSNSWGGPSSDDSPYTDIINDWGKLGITPVFSAGNSGPECGSVGSPGDFVNVISVGSTTQDDTLSDFSSRGPCTSGMVGPTVSAPGEKITSTWHTSDKAYRTISGTSMACPHVSGTVALMKQENHGLSFNDAKSILQNTCTNTGLGDPEQTCGGMRFTEQPNNLYGNGRINCAAAVKSMLDMQQEAEDKQNIENGESSV